MNPQSAIHLDAAARNQSIAYQLLHRVHLDANPQPDDWIITILFYSALHLVDAYLLEPHGSKPRNHVQRGQLVRNDPLLSTIADYYIALYTMSRTSRYRPLVTFEPHDVQQAFDQLQLIRQTVIREIDRT